LYSLTKHKKLIGGLLVSLLLFLGFYFNVLQYFEFKAQDALYQRPIQLSAPDVYVLGIDEQSFARFGRMQNWSRNIMAEAVNILNADEDYRPAVVAIDILFAHESGEPEADDNLAQAAKNAGNVVVVSSVVTTLDDNLNMVIDQIETPYEPLSEYAVQGLANSITDSDGVIRNATLKAPYEGGFLDGFPYAVYKAFTYAPLDFAENNDTAYIAYSGRPRNYYAGSFADIFDEDFEPEFFADAIVLIGPYAPGMMDSYYTPVSATQQMYGVEIHANVIQMLLDENFKVYMPEWVNWLVFFAVVAMALFLGERTDIRVFLGAVILFCAAYIFAALWLYGAGYVSMLVYPIVTMLVLYGYHLIYGYVLERLEKQELKRAFKKYVDPKLVDKLMKTGEANSDKVGEKRDIAVLFVDVRGFTPMTEALKDRPELIVQILNEYLELTSTAIFNNGGSVDKFIGDATMALFNGFVPLDDYVFKAVNAAWEMVTRAKSVNASIKEKYGVDVGFGVGVNCGEGIVGNLGPSFRKDYTAIGDTVNTAARLESNAARSQLLISEYVYVRIKDRIQARSVGEIPLKGKSDKLEVYEVLGVLAH